MEVILAAIGCGQAHEVADISNKHGRVVLGSMDGVRLQPLAARIRKGDNIPLYFYETG